MEYTFEEYLNHDWKYARTEDYFVYLVGLLMYSYHDDFSYETSFINKLIDLLYENKDYIPIPYLSTFYIVSSLYYVKQGDWKHSYELCMKAKMSAMNDLSHAYALYHLGKHHSYSCNLHEALDVLKLAKSLFDTHFYIKNSFYTQIEIGLVYLKMGLYIKAEIIFNECLALNKKYSIDLSCSTVLYSMYIYSCLNAKNYDKCIELCNYMITKDIIKSKAYLGLAISFYYKDNMEKAMNNITKARKTKDDYNLSVVDKEMIQAYHFVIYGKKCEIIYR